MEMTAVPTSNKYSCRSIRAARNNKKTTVISICKKSEEKKLKGSWYDPLKEWHKHVSKSSSTKND